MPFSLLQSLATIPIACVDVETSGASASWGDRIIEVGIVRFEGGKKVAEYQQLIDPKRHISAGVTALTGITQAMCQGQMTFVDAIPHMLPLFKGAAILGHNVRFDLSFLLSEFRRGGIDLPVAIDNAPVLDTVRIARRRFGRGGNGLGMLARMGYVPETAHRALPDAVTTMRVFEQLLAPVAGWNTCLCDVMREQGGPMALVSLGVEQNFLPLELEEALEQQRPVLMEYLDADQSRTERTIQPLRIRRKSGEFLLVAHCHLRNDRRAFKLERIVRLKRIEESAEAKLIG